MIAEKVRGKGHRLVGLGPAIHSRRRAPRKGWSNSPPPGWREAGSGTPREILFGYVSPGVR